MSGVIVARGENSTEVRFQCKWHANNTATDASGVISWQSIDIFFKEKSRSSSFSWPTNTEENDLLIEVPTGEQHKILPQDFGSTAAFQFVLDCISAANNKHGSAARLAVPQSHGYIIRSDIIPLRLLDCALVTSVVAFATPHQFFDGKPMRPEALQQLFNALTASAGGMLLKNTCSDRIKTIDSQLSHLNIELHNRLSFPWLSMQVPKRKTLALVEGGRRSPDHGGNGEAVFKAAEALGIDMVVLDNPGHWLDGPRWSHWRKAFIPIECTLQSDPVFTRRVVDAISSYDGHIDAIVTFCDHYKEPVAEAALQLSLSTCSPEAYALATDKFRLRRFEGDEAYRASSMEQATSIVLEHKLEFPLIMKPCTGYLSEGVFRVENLSQLEADAQSLNVERHGADFAIERYCDGPEVDANFVLCDGELLFFEASDEFPKGADVNGYGSVKSFVELGNILPSNLPGDELALLRDSLHQSLLRVGFQDGIYHLEARVANSRTEYAIKDDVLDITERSVPAKAAPSAWLIEINPRPPGIQASDATKHTYGVDYWGLGLLFALEDRDRVKQLSHPFAQGPQYWCEMVFIPVEKGGVFDSEDVCAELFSRRPDLADCVSWCHCFSTKGDQVLDPSSTGVNSWVAHFNVFSRSSRAHVLEIAECVRQEVRFSVVKISFQGMKENE
ncbi:hypothetical protein BO71DRAFT_353772 [Aspergillus ellipticus CBS 707.79]|uniref:ATP-grasp domain-containing protein n=1 Tax=Aspergillus ellipticus CBS 707.79 TaxID=1448320 RepID=A0A319DAM4_9EURO|nr:hypothetical protein BO71DRAFT_353772 [Aspergillus ellipticus CBS 707.79]